MTLVKQLLLLDPLDTLFFRGSDQMVAGENHEITSMFPPMPSTIRGAIRTAIMYQRGIDPHAFNRESGPDETIKEAFPLLGTPEAPGFDVCGPVFTVGEDHTKTVWFVPAPANWFADLSSRVANNGSATGIEVRIPQALPEGIAELGLCGTVKAPLLIKEPPHSAYKSLSGCWTTMTAVEKLRGRDSGQISFSSNLPAPTRDEDLIVPLHALAVSERRVGIGMNVSTRRVKKGHLYGTTHFRLQPAVKLAIGVSEELAPSHLDERGLLRLGGEQRMVGYEVIPSRDSVWKTDGDWAMALNPVPTSIVEDLSWGNNPRFSGPVMRVAGWDMRKRFHKKTTAYFPAGTVFRVDTDKKLPFGFIRI